MLHADCVWNITFHGLGIPPDNLEDKDEASVWVSVRKFEEILEQVKGRPDIRISFDDGNVSDIEIALPRLLEGHLTAEIFVVSGRIGAERYLSSVEIRELDKAGMTIGCHGMAHRSWRGLSSSEAQSEIVDSRKMLEDIVGKKVKHAAPPFGEYDRRLLQILAESDYESVYTTDSRPARPDAWLQARTPIGHGTEILQIGKILRNEYPLHERILRSAKCFVKRHR